MKNHQNNFQKNDHIDIAQNEKRRMLPKITSIILIYLKLEAYSEPCQTYKMECFAKINDVKGYFCLYKRKYSFIFRLNKRKRLFSQNVLS